MPWWAYGPQGMQLWFPSLLSQQPAGISSTTSGHLPASLTPTGSSSAQRQSMSLGSPGNRPSLSLGSPVTGRGGNAVGVSLGARLGSGGWGRGEASATDIELEFDREVYPIGVSLADAAIVGVTQRLTRSAIAVGDGQVSEACWGRGGLRVDLRACMVAWDACVCLAAAGIAKSYGKHAMVGSPGVHLMQRVATLMAALNIYCISTGFVHI